jgi:acyl carrier protein
MNDIGQRTAPATADTGQISDAIVHLYEEVFKNIDIGVDSDFLDLGGDSLMATSLMAGIEQQFGVTLALAVLLEAPTPRELAEVIAAEVQKGRHALLLTVRRQGEGPPLFCVHGMDGFSLFPGRLAELLPGRPVYALRALGLERGEVPLPTVRAIAASYLDEMRRVHPRGPCIVIGQCGPCLVAYEMAQQLRQRGAGVPALIMLDPPVAEQVSWRVRDPEMLRLIAEGADQMVRRAMKRARDNPDLPGKGRVAMMSKLLTGAIAAYRPVPYHGDTLVIYSSPRKTRLLDPEQGMPRLLPRMTAVQIGDSHKEVFRSAVATAAAIREFLDRVSPVPA